MNIRDACERKVCVSCSSPYSGGESVRKDAHAAGKMQSCDKRLVICVCVRFVFLLGLQRAWRRPHIWQAGCPPAPLMGSSCGSRQPSSRGGAGGTIAGNVSSPPARMEMQVSMCRGCRKKRLHHNR